VQLCSGLGYTFSIYSPALKEHFGYTQTEIAGIGTACNIGGYLAVFAGAFFDLVKGWR
jgi:Nodulin-like